MTRWDVYKTEHAYIETYSCHVEHRGIEYPFTVVVGKIKRRNDGRWNWWIFPDKDFRNPHIQTSEAQQGTGTYEEAKAKVEANYA